MFQRMTTIAKNAVKFAQKHALAIVGGVAVAASSVPAHATPVLDFTGVSSAVTTELSPAITAAMPIAGIILAAGIGWKLYKRFTK